MLNTKINSQMLMVIGLLIALSPFSFGEPGYSYDLSGSVVDVLGGSQITTVAVDSERSIVYFGTIDGKFGYYNETSNSSTDLTSTIQPWGAGQFWSMTLDTTSDRLYFSVGQLNNEVGYYKLSPNTSTQLGTVFSLFTKLQYDPKRDIIWYASNDGDLGYISKLNDSRCPQGVTGGSVSDICLDNYFNRVYIYYVASTKFPEYYAIGNQTQVDLSSNHPIDIQSCSLDQIRHRIYLGTPNGFAYHNVYYQLNDTLSPLFTTGDTAGTPRTVYIPHNNIVGFIEYSAFADGMIYNVSSKVITRLFDTDVDNWMNPYFMDAGDYNNNSNRLYIGFTGGGFGYYDNGYTYSYPLEYFNISVDFTNHSNINLSNISNYPIVGRFTSWNETALNITLYLNGTYEDSVIATNNTDFLLNINSINGTGSYVIRIRAPQESLIYYFRVVEVSPNPFLSNSSLIAIAMLVIASVTLITILGITTQNEMLKLLLCTTAIAGIVGLSWLAYLFADYIGAGEDIKGMILTFVLIFLIITIFVVFYTIYSFTIYVLVFLTKFKEKGWGAFKKEDEANVYK